jgi:hypothetical protein
MPEDSTDTPLLPFSPCKEEARSMIKLDPEVLMPEIIIDVGRQMDGATFRLSPQTSARLTAQKLGHPLASSIFVTFTTKEAFERDSGSMWTQIAMLLTGLAADQIKELGGFRFVDPTDREVLFESRAA